MLYSNMDKNDIQFINLLIAYNILSRNKNKEKDMLHFISKEENVHKMVYYK